MTAANALEVSVEFERPDGGRIRLVGDLDFVTRDTFLSAVDDVLDTGPRHLSVDLSGIQFLDSAGLHALVTLARRAASAGIRLVLVGGSSAVQRVVDISGLRNHLPFARG